MARAARKKRRGITVRAAPLTGLRPGRAGRHALARVQCGVQRVEVGQHFQEQTLVWHQHLHPVSTRGRSWSAATVSDGG